LWEGAKGDGLTDDSNIFNRLMETVEPNAILELSGRTFLIDGEVNLTKPITMQNGILKFSNGGLVVPAGINNTTFINVTFDGVDRQHNGVTVNYPSKEHRFIGCQFINNKIGLRTIANMDTQQDLFVSNCSFNGNDIGLSLKDLKRATITSNKFYNNHLGFESETVDYQGIGMVFSDNYLNGNAEGSVIRGGLYDSLISNNIFDHNNFNNDADTGFGLKITVPTERYMRNVGI